MVDLTHPMYVDSGLSQLTVNFSLPPFCAFSKENSSNSLPSNFSTFNGLFTKDYLQARQFISCHLSCQQSLALTRICLVN